MINALGLLAAWGVGLFSIFGFWWLVSIEDDTHTGFLGKAALVCLATSIVSSVIREYIIAIN